MGKLKGSIARTLAKLRLKIDLKQLNNSLPEESRLDESELYPRKYKSFGAQSIYDKSNLSQDD